MGTQIERMCELCEMSAHGVDEEAEDESAFCEDRWLHAQQHFSGVKARVQGDADIRLQQELNDALLEMERVREELMAERGDELDDLVKLHDFERRDLHQEVRELHRECASMAAVASQPPHLLDLHAHLESRLGVMQEELSTQLADWDARVQAQKQRDEIENDELRKSLHSCQAELSASQSEFKTLATLFDQERREHLKLKDASGEAAQLPIT